MNTEKIIELVSVKGSVRSSEGEELFEFSEVVSNDDVKNYIRSCLSADGVFASGMRVKSLSQLRDENLADAGPGGYIFPYGFLVIATSIGGNAICVDGVSSRVYWANSGDFLDDCLSFEDQESDEWLDLEYSHPNILRALELIDVDFEHFLVELLSDSLESRLEALD